MKLKSRQQSGIMNIKMLESCLEMFHLIVPHVLKRNYKIKEIVMRPFTFKYTRSTKERKVQYQLEHYMDELSKLGYRRIEEGGTITEEELQRFLGKIDKITQGLGE